MAFKEVSIGSVGPFLYDDANFYGIHTTGQQKVETAPTEAEHVMRLMDMPPAPGYSNTNVTGSRAFNTTYSNPNAARALLVMATGRCAISLAGGQAFLQAYQDTSTPPTTIDSGAVGIASGLLNEDNGFQLVFVVPAGTNQKYRINTTEVNGTVTLGAWFEAIL